jgi:hypothetical protein
LFAQQEIVLQNSFIFRIIALMAITWIVAGRLIFRPLFATKISEASVQTLPNVDNILFLIRDIYLAREHEKWSLEKRLFQKLVFLFQSPETLILWSRIKPKDSQNEPLPPSLLEKLLEKLLGNWLGNLLEKLSRNWLGNLLANCIK